MRALLRCLALLVILSTALAADVEPAKENIAKPFSEFQFMRVHYTAVIGSRSQRWLTDWPDAERNVITGIGRLSRINIADEGDNLRLTDDRLFDYPWIYAVEVGGWELSDEEAARLREYLLRGGFLMVDDFHGTREWETFMASMRRVFPDRNVVDLSVTDPVFHIAYDLDDHVQIPGSAALSRGVTYEYDGYQPHWRGIYDDSGRLMVIINFNMDLGDAWELADQPDYPVHYTVSAYKYAVNYVLYSMTH